jgi:hypothetical protein
MMREVQTKLETATQAIDRLESGAGDVLACRNHLDALLRTIDEAEKEAMQPAQRQRLNSARAEYDTLVVAVDSISKRLERKRRAATDREALLGRRNQDFENIGHSATAPDAGEQYLDRERDSLRHTARHVAQMTEESDAVLNALKAQRLRMQGTQAKLEGVLQSLGVSDQAIRQIRNMNSTDAIIIAGGCVLLVLLMLYLWFS